MRPNLLDNAYFVGGGTGWGVFPVNQRGQVTFTAVNPMFDRWKAAYGINFTSQLLAAGWKLSGGTPWTSYLQMLRQSFIAGDLYTLTALFSDGSLVTGQVTAPSHSEGEYSGNVYLTSSSYMRLAYNAGDSFEIIAASGDTIPTIEFLKLEHGAGQTAAYQDEEGNWQLFETPDYGEELAKCQRYLLTFANYGDPYLAIGMGTSFIENAVQIQIPLPVPMRTKPTLVMIGAWVLRGDGQAVFLAEGTYQAGISTISPGMVSIIINEITAGGITLNQAFELIRNNNTTAEIILSAEL